MLMMVDKIECSPKPNEDIIKKYKDYNQVVLDVNRSLKRFPPGIPDDYRLVLMDQLTTLIIRVLIKHPDLHYYQVTVFNFTSLFIHFIIIIIFQIILKVLSNKIKCSVLNSLKLNKDN